VSDTFQSRHIGPRDEDIHQMLEAVGAASVDALVAEIIPQNIRHARPLDLPPAESEFEYHQRLRRVAATNRVNRS